MREEEGKVNGRVLKEKRRKRVERRDEQKIWVRGEGKEKEICSFPVVFFFFFPVAVFSSLTAHQPSISPPAHQFNQHTSVTVVRQGLAGE